MISRVPVGAIVGGRNGRAEHRGQGENDLCHSPKAHGVILFLHWRAFRRRVPFRAFARDPTVVYRGVKIIFSKTATRRGVAALGHPAPDPKDFQLTDQTPFRPFETLIDRDTAEAIVKEAVFGADDGELFLERRRAEVLSFERRTAPDGELRRLRGIRAARGARRDGGLTPIPPRSASGPCAGPPRPPGSRSARAGRRWRRGRPGDESQALRRFDLSLAEAGFA